MIIGFASIMLALIILYLDKKMYSKEAKDNNPNNFGYDIKTYGGIIVFIILGIVLIFCDIFNLWIFK